MWGAAVVVCACDAAVDSGPLMLDTVADPLALKTAPEPLALDIGVTCDDRGVLDNEAAEEEEGEGCVGKLEVDA